MRRGLAQLGLPTTDAVVSLVVFVVVGSLTIAVPVVYYLVGGEQARTPLDDLKEWLTVHNDAVMTVLFLVFGVNLIAKAIPPLTADRSPGAVRGCFRMRGRRHPRRGRRQGLPGCWGRGDRRRSSR